MDRTQFFFDVLTEVRYTRDELNNMIQCAYTHYDEKCRAAVNRPGFLCAMDDDFVTAEIVAKKGHEKPIRRTRVLTRGQLDILCKILESPGAAPELSWNVMTLLREAGAKLRELDERTTHIPDGKLNA